MSVSIEKLTAFITVVEAGGFTPAASMLGRNQSSVSRMIASIEEEWGVRLFIRNGSGLTLTPDGSRLLTYAREVLRSNETLDRFASSIANLDTGELRLAAPSSVASHRLAGPVTRFLEEHPHLNVTMIEATYDEAERLLRADEVDLAFLDKRIDETDFAAVMLERDELMVVAPRNLIPGLGAVSMPQVMELPYIGDSETAPRLLEKHPNLRVRCITSDISVILALVEAGVGISILPKLALSRASYDIDVRPLDNTVFRNIFLARRRKVQLSAAAIEFLSYIGVPI